MKTVKKILVLHIALLLGYCTEPYESNAPRQNNTFEKSLHITADITDEPIMELEEGMTLQLYGESTNYLVDNVSFAITGHVSHMNNLKEYELPNSQLELFVKDSGSYLKGYFEGKGTKTSGRTIIWGTIKVEFGTGVFEADDGELRLSIIGAESFNSPMTYTVEIDGYLSREIVI